MKAKTWALMMCLAYIGALGLLFAIAWVFAAPTRVGVFNMYDDDYLREKKADFLKAHADEFDSFMFAGSKGGALHAETLSELTGQRFFNYWSNSGNFYDYEHFIEFLLREKKTPVKEIVLHLSVHEVQEYKRKDFLPPAMQKNPIAALYYRAKVFPKVFLNASLIISSRRIPKGEDGTNIYELSPQGSRSIAYDRYNQNRIKSDSAAFKKEVLSYWTDYDMAIENLFRMEQRLPACDDNIAALRRIKAKCDERGITLTVVLAPTFVSELYMYKSPQFWDYFRAIAEVQPFWNFSGINAVSMNPYNFVNGGHYFYFIGDRMANIMFGTDDRASESAAAADFGGMDDFGQFITPENVDAYIARQTELWLTLKDEYERTGTVTLIEE